MNGYRQAQKFCGSCGAVRAADVSTCEHCGFGFETRSGRSGDSVDRILSNIFLGISVTIIFAVLVNVPLFSPGNDGVDITWLKSAVVGQAAFVVALLFFRRELVEFCWPGVLFSRSVIFKILSYSVYALLWAMFCMGVGISVFREFGFSWSLMVGLTIEDAFVWSLAAMVVPVLAEEIVFRGVVMNAAIGISESKSKNKGAWASIVASSLCRLSLIDPFIYGPIAWLLARLRNETNSILPGIVVRLFVIVSVYLFILLFRDSAFWLQLTEGLFEAGWDEF